MSWGYLADPGGFRYFQNVLTAGYLHQPVCNFSALFLYPGHGMLLGSLIGIQIGAMVTSGQGNFYPGILCHGGFWTIFQPNLCPAGEND
jgi:hypothetical protein